MAETDTVVARLRAKKTQYGSHVGEYEIDASDLEIEAADLIAKLMNRVTEAEAAREAAEAKAARLREAAAELRRIAHRYLAQFSGVQRDVYAVADRIDAALAAGGAGGVWRTMDTAPKDGTPILVWWPIVVINADDGTLTDQEVGGTRLVTEWSGGSWLEPECLNGLNSVAFDDDREYAENPTLWCRLPEIGPQVAAPVPTGDDGRQLDRFPPEDYRNTADLLRSTNEGIIKATASNNLNIILAALDHASILSALEPAPSALVAEPAPVAAPAGEGEPFAFCCASFDIDACDCVNKNHGTARRG